MTDVLDLATIDPDTGGYTAGDDFNYASWHEDTQLTLVNVRWDAAYRDVVRFTSQPQLDAWIDGKPNIKFMNASLQKFNTDVTIDTPINAAMKYNYIRAKNMNSVVGDEPRTYYYFITDIAYVAGNTTLLRLQLDVWQTFGYEVRFGNSYIERGHIGMANEHAFDHYGRDYLTAPEGFDIGSEYQIVHTAVEQLMSTTAPTNDPLAYDVLICSTLDLTQPGINSEGRPQIFSAIGSSFQGLPSGANFYIFRTPDMFSAWLAVNSQYPWLTESIMSITCIPSMSRYVPNYDYGPNLGDDNIKWYRAGFTNDIPQPHSTSKLPDWRDSDFIANTLGPRYAGLKKFLTFPYLLIELTTWTGSPLVIKPEAWQDPDATVREMCAFVPPGQRIAIMPKGYNKSDVGNDVPGAIEAGEGLDFATFLDNFPTLPVVNNGALLYLANNKNGIAYQYSSARWDQSRAMQGAQAGYDVAGSQIRSTAQQSGIANSLATSQAGLQATTGMNNAMLGIFGSGGLSAAGNAAEAGGGLGGAAGIGAAGAVAQMGLGTMQAGASANAMMEGAGFGVAARGESAIAEIQNQGRVRDINTDYARNAARGDYKNAITGANARVQDAYMTQPSTSGQFGGDAFNIVNNMYGWALRWKMGNLDALRRIGNIWLRYGYAVQQFSENIPVDFMCMTKFTYWDLKETYISQGSFPELFKNTIRGIFEKGVTVWRNPDDIGNIDLADNQPISGITL